MKVVLYVFSFCISFSVLGQGLEPGAVTANLWNSSSLFKMTAGDFHVIHDSEDFDLSNGYNVKVLNQQFLWGCKSGSVWGLSRTDDFSGFDNTMTLMEICGLQLKPNSFIPSINELSEMFESLNPHDLLKFDGYYMSSTELDFYSNYVVYIKNGDWKKSILAKQASQKLIIFERKMP